MDKIKSYIFLIFINISILLTLFILIEKISFGGNKSKIIIGRKRYINLRENRPNSSKIYSNFNLLDKNLNNDNLKNYKVVTNDDGFIINGENNEGDFDYYLFLGGSTTECVLVDDKLRFPAIVSSKLSSKENKINSLNSGVSGNSSIHSLNILINKGLKYKPKYIFIMHNINDLNSLLRMGSYFNENNYSSREGKNIIVFEPSLRQLLTKKLKDKTKELFPKIYNFYLLNKLRYSKSKTSNDIFERRKNIQTFNIKRNFRNNIESIISVSKIHGSQPILMTQMSRISEILAEDIKLNLLNEVSNLGITYSEYYLLFNEFNEIIRQVAEEYNVPLVDLDKKIPKDSKYMYDVIHLTEEGSKMVAKNIIELLNEIN